MGFTSEARWLRYARAHLCHLFPYLPQQPGYNKRLRGAAPLIRHCIRALAASTASWTDDVWIVDSTPWSAAAPARLPNAPTWPDGPNTGTAPAIRATSAACACTWSLPWLAGRPARRVRPGRSRSRRARRPAGHLHRRSGPDHLPARPGAARRPPATASPARSRAPVQTTAPDHRISQRHPQGPARPRTPRRPHTQRRDHPHLAAHPGPAAAIWHNDTTSPPQRLPRKSHSKSQRRPPSDDISRRGAERLFAQFKCSVSPVEPRSATPRR